MDRIDSVHVIGKKKNKCPVCSALLNRKECEIAVYSQENQSRIYEQHLSERLLYCCDCTLYYAQHKDTMRINAVSDFHVWTKPHDEYNQKVANKKKVNSLPRRINNLPPPIGKSIFHGGDEQYFGKGVIIGFSENKIKIKFESRNKTVSLALLTEHIKFYRLNEPELMKFLEAFAIRNSEEQKIKEKEIVEKKAAEKAKPKPRNVDLTSGEGIYPIYLCHGIVGCEWKDYHELESVKAKVLTLEKDGHVIMNAIYCKSCNEYFIRHNTYSDYVSRYGPLVLNPVSYSRGSNGYYNSGDMYANLNPKSSLAIHGYSAKCDTSDIERQKKLVSIIAFRLMEKHDIISHLESLLDLQGNNSNHIEANKKRRADLRFLNNYDIEKQREVFCHIIDRAERYRSRYLIFRQRIGQV